MDLEKQRQEEHAVRQILSEDLGERNIVPRGQGVSKTKALSSILLLPL